MKKSLTLSTDIFNSYRQDILNTRSNLFTSIGNNSEKIKDACKDILLSKQNENETPLWGELYPWFIVDLIGVNRNVIKDVSKGWLAIYLHTIFIDKHLDKKIEIKPVELLASSILAKEGLLNLQKIVLGSKYEKIFEDSLNSSADYELADVLNKLDFDSLGRKEEIAIGKNRILLACAGALAAVNKTYGDYIIRLTSSLLLSLQFLDDIKDIEEDYKEKNFTYILSYAFKDSSSIDSSMSKEKIIEKLFLSGALENTVLKVVNCLTCTFDILGELKTKFVKESSAYVFLDSLYSELSSLHHFLSKNKILYINSPLEYRSVILDEIETRIIRCDMPS